MRCCGESAAGDAGGAPRSASLASSLKLRGAGGAHSAPGQRSAGDALGGRRSAVRVHGRTRLSWRSFLPMSSSESPGASKSPLASPAALPAASPASGLAPEAWRKHAAARTRQPRPHQPPRASARCCRQRGAPASAHAKRSAWQQRRNEAERRTGAAVLSAALHPDANWFSPRLAARVSAYALALGAA